MTARHKRIAKALDYAKRYDIVRSWEIERRIRKDKTEVYWRVNPALGGTRRLDIGEVEAFLTGVLSSQHARTYRGTWS